MTLGLSFIAYLAKQLSEYFENIFCFLFRWKTFFLLFLFASFLCESFCEYVCAINKGAIYVLTYMGGPYQALKPTNHIFNIFI